jgi:UDP-N-acetylglucosamine--N-acetylmuramyl-(pentapeptide) pyrophosphoryl-undecaprenol N-acetylglucosamine transferase
MRGADMATIVLAGGGTGGHLYPALAIGDMLASRGHRIVYYGDPDRLEGRVVPEKGLPFRPVKAPQFPRRGRLKQVLFVFSLLGAIIKTWNRLRKDGADVVFGVGGYISVPTLVAGKLLGARIVIHEANVVPGMANKLAGRFSDMVLLTYEETRSRLVSKAPKHLVGVPVSPDISKGERVEAGKKYGLDPEKATVVFVGGSLGAERINELALGVMAFPSRAFQVIHLTGKRYFDEVVAQLDGTPEGTAVVDYEDRMDLAFSMADLMVSRSGSSTLGEIAATGTASLLIPSPHVTENHQEHNARGLASIGAAEVLLEANWSLSDSVAIVAKLMEDTDTLVKMANAAQGASMMEAACSAADHIETLIH